VRAQLHGADASGQLHTRVTTSPNVHARFIEISFLRKLRRTGRRRENRKEVTWRDGDSSPKPCGAR
jgi:hypothetical protein